MDVHPFEKKFESLQKLTPIRGRKPALSSGYIVLPLRFTEANPDKGTKTFLPPLQFQRLTLFTEANPDKGTKVLGENVNSCS